MLKAYREGRAVSWWVESAVVFAITAALIWPLFFLGYSDKWASIESTFIADARFLRDHWPHPQWQPLWYTGTRFDYIYPPALRYGTAALAKTWPWMSTARAYHLYVALLYCVGIAGVYALARMGGKSRKFAVAAALAVATVSPSFLFIPEIRQDARGSWSEPQRLGVLIRYGEGPHISAVAMLGLALAFSMEALRSGRWRWISASAAACALVVAHNFYGATALAMLFPVLLWSWWITHQDNRMFVRAAAIAALSYGLCAFWLVPSYVQVTLDNMRFVSERGNRWSMWVTAALAILFLKQSEKWARGRRELAYPVFLAGALGLFGLNVVGNYYLKFRVIGEPLRMVPELDMLILLAGVEILRRVWEADSRLAVPRRVFVAVAFLLLFFSVRKYITGGWNIYVSDPNPQARLEYRITDWLAKNRPQARAYTNGATRFWFNAWYDLAELGGGSEQGLLNPVVQPATWHLGMSDDIEHGIAWMQATGVDVAIVHDKSSKEHYKDVQHPEAYAKALKAVYSDGEGNFVYEVPRRYPGLARVVDSGRLDALPPLPEDPPKEMLKEFADLLEKGSDAPVETRWVSTEELRIKARVYAGHSVFVQVAFDPSWRAEVDGRPAPIGKSQLNFMRIEAPEGDREIRLVFQKPLENTAGQIVFAVTAAGMLWMCRRRGRAL